MDVAAARALFERDDVHIVVRGGAESVLTFAKLPHVSEKAPQRWVHMAREGLWKGHHSGREIQFTRELFGQFIERFNATKNPTATKYGHPDGDDFPAAGWVLDVEVRNSGLWGLVEFTPRAAKAIEEGEFRYCSVEFALESIDRETGEPSGPVLSGLGLTNVPFIDGLTPITLSRVGTPARDPAQEFHMATDMQPQKVIQLLAKDVGLKADATIDAIMRKIAAIATYMKAIEEPADLPPPPAAEELSADPVKASAWAEKTRTALSANPKARALIKLSDELMETPADAESAASATMIADKLMTLTSLDAPGVLAALDANGDAIAAAFSGVAASGTPAETSALSTVRSELSLVKMSNAALGQRVATLESEKATMRATEEAAAKVAAEEAHAAVIKFALDEGHVVKGEQLEGFEVYARTVGPVAAKKFALSLPKPPTGAITKDAVKAAGGTVATLALSDVDCEARDEDERALLKFSGVKSKTDKALVLRTHRAKSDTTPAA